MGGRWIELHYLGPSHTDNIAVGYIPDVAVAFAVDFVSNDRPGYQDLATWHFPEFFDAVSGLLGIPFETIVFGHGPPGDRTAIQRQIAYYDDLTAAVRDAVANGLTEDEAAESVRLAAAARSANKPMVWTEIYAGGIGGFVGRVRPGIDPPPHTARRQYLAWCRDQKVPWIGDDRDYDSQAPNGPTLIGGDADVSVIAGHASRLALDTLMRPLASEFPHPAYVIGLAQAWIFTEPFDVHPFDFASEGTWDTEIAKGQVDKAIERIVSILEGNSAKDRTGI